MTISDARKRNEEGLCVRYNPLTQGKCDRGHWGSLNCKSDVLCPDYKQPKYFQKRKEKDV